MAASRRSGSARRSGPREARFVHVVDLARQSHAMVFAWWNPCIIRPCCAGWRRNGRRAGSGEARFVNLANLARQSHRPLIVAFFHLSSKGMWLVACSPRRPRMSETCVILSYLLFFCSLCGQAIIAAAGRRLWRRRSTAGCALQVSQDSRSHISCLIRYVTTYDQASLRLHEFRKISNAAGAGIRFI